MKIKSLLMLVVGLTFALTACAQQGPRGERPSAEEMAKRQTEMIQKATGIDKATAEKLNAINLKYAKQMQEMREKSGDQREAMRESMVASREAREAEIKALLTEEQYTKYKKHQEEMRNRQKEGQGHRGPRP